MASVTARGEPALRRARRLLLSGVVLVAALGSSIAAARVGDEPAGAARSYIVVYEGDNTPVASTTDRLEDRLDFDTTHRYSHALDGFSAVLDDAQISDLSDDPRVAFISADRTVKADAAVPLAAGEPLPPTGVRRIDAATTTTAREASGAGVAIIDTGIQLNHPDLNALPGTNCINPSASPADDHGHGTHVAGTIAAKNDGSGVVGVAPGTFVYAVKVLSSSGSGSWSNVICGIDWVTAHAAALNIKVANMSLGGDGSGGGQSCATTTNSMRLAICNSTGAGVTYVVAAGNDGVAFDPAAFEPASFPEALTVTAVADSDGSPGGVGGSPSCRTATDDAPASFSNWAATVAGRAHTIAAPGVCIRSTYTGSGYSTLSGTSMASPAVAGLVALCIDEAGAPGPCAGKTPSQIIDTMRGQAEGATTTEPFFGFTGDPLHSPTAGRYFGFMARFAGSGPPQPPQPPVNDAFASAKVLPDYPSTISTSNWGGTVEPGEPDHAGKKGGASVWYRWTAPNSGNLTIALCGSGFDTLLGVYNGSEVGALTQVGANDNGCTSGSGSRLGLHVVRGQTYLIAIDGAAGADGRASTGLINMDFILEIPPANDAFADSTDLGRAPSLTASGTNVGASLETGEPQHAGNAGGASVWYRWTAPDSGTAVIALCGSNFDTLVGVYTGSGVDGLTQAGAADNGCPTGAGSRLQVPVVRGQSYSIAVDGALAASGRASAGLISMNLNLLLPPANDAFADASDLGSALNVTTSSTNVGATRESGEPQHAGNAGGASVWFRWTAPRSGRFSVSLCGSSFDTTLGIYSGEALSSLTQEAGNDDSCGTKSQATFIARAGHTYRIAADGKLSGAYAPQGTVQLAIAPVPPANDGVASAEAIQAEADVFGTNQNATKEAGEPDHATNTGGASVWYRWSPDVSGNYVVSVCGADFDTLLGVYAGAAITSLHEIAGDDDGCGAQGSSRLTMSAFGGATYLVAVDGADRGSGAAFGSFNLRIALKVPENDAFADAAALGSDPQANATGGTFGATLEAGEPAPGGIEGEHSVWYRWTAPSSGRTWVDTCGSAFDTVLGIYRGDSIGSLTSVASNDDSCGYQSRVGFTATQGTEYRFQVQGFSERSGDLELSVGSTDPPQVEEPATREWSGHTIDDRDPELGVSFVDIAQSTPGTTVSLFNHIPGADPSSWALSARIDRPGQAPLYQDLAEAHAGIGRGDGSPAGGVVAAWHREDTREVRIAEMAPGADRMSPSFPAQPPSWSDSARGTPYVAVNEAGAAVVAFPSASGGNELVTARYRPPGGSFGTGEAAIPPVSAASAYLTDLALGADGTVVAGGVRDGKVVVTVRPPGGSFGQPFVIADQGPSQPPPVRVGVDRAGDVVAAWIRSDGYHSGPVMMAVRPAGGRFGPPMYTGLNTPEGYGLDMGVSALGEVLVVAEELDRSDGGWYTGGGVQALSANAHTGQMGKPEKLSDGSGGAPRMSMNERGDAIVAWHHCCDGGLVARRRAPLGTFGPPVEIPPDPARASTAGYRSLRTVDIDGYGNAAAAWQEGGTGASLVSIGADGPLAVEAPTDPAPLGNRITPVLFTAPPPPDPDPDPPVVPTPDPPGTTTPVTPDPGRPGTVDRTPPSLSYDVTATRSGRAGTAITVKLMSDESCVATIGGRAGGRTVRPVHLVFGAAQPRTFRLRLLPASRSLRAAQRTPKTVRVTFEAADSFGNVTHLSATRRILSGARHARR